MAIDGRTLWWLVAIMVLTGVAILAEGQEPPDNRELAEVKDRGFVDLETFDCDDDTRSSDILRICYEASLHYLLLNLPYTLPGEDSDAGWNRHLQFCNVPPETVAGLKAAPSVVLYYRDHILRHARGGRFDCKER